MANVKIDDLDLYKPAAGSYVNPETFQLVTDELNNLTRRQSFNQLGPNVVPEMFREAAIPEEIVTPEEVKEGVRRGDGKATMTERKINREAINEALKIPGVRLILDSYDIEGGPIEMNQPFTEIVGHDRYGGLFNYEDGGATLRIEAQSFCKVSGLTIKDKKNRRSDNQGLDCIVIGHDEVTDPQASDYDEELWVKGRSPADLPAGSSTQVALPDGTGTHIVDNENLWLPRGVFGHELRMLHLDGISGRGIVGHAVNDSVFEDINTQNVGREHFYFTGGLENTGTGSFVGRACPRSFGLQFRTCRGDASKRSIWYLDNCSMVIMDAINALKWSRTSAGPPQLPRVVLPGVWIRAGHMVLCDMLDAEAGPRLDQRDFTQWSIYWDGASPYDAIYGPGGYGHRSGHHYFTQVESGEGVDNTSDIFIEPSFPASGVDHRNREVFSTNRWPVVHTFGVVSNEPNFPKLQRRGGNCPP